MSNTKIPAFDGRKIRLVEAVNQLGLGGTEYALQLYCKFLNKEVFDVTVVSMLEGGERVKLIEELGIQVIVLNGDFSKLPEILTNTDVLHWHGSGNCSPDAAFFEVVKAHKPRLVIQTNVFGAFDHSPYYNLIDQDLYISKMVLVRRMALDKDFSNYDDSKRKVLPYPVDTDLLHLLTPTAEEILSFKAKNKLTSFFIVGRVGRADNHKFDMVTLDGFSSFARKNDQARFLIVGATAEMKSHAERLNILDKLIIFENTADLKTLLLYYKTIDIFLAASRIGESFGMVIAEAMTAGTPVVTVSTEDRDNAQIELIDNEKSGLVTKRKVKDISKALEYLYSNKKVYSEIAIESKKKIATDYKAQKIVESLEHLILTEFGISTGHYKDKTLIQPYSKEMVDDYKKRCINLFGRSSISKFLIWQYKKLF